jgi:phage protein D
MSVGGLPSSSVLNDRLVSISVTLNNGEVSDQLSLEFDDRDTVFFGGISLPRQGVPISVSLGYEVYTAEMGKFIVNRLSSSGSSGGRTLSVSATPALLNADYTRTWSGTIGDIVDAIAQEHNLTAKVSPTLTSETIDVINQLNESNSAFLARLAARYNAVFKPMADNLLFMAKGEGTSASGLPMLPVNIPPHDVIQWSKSINEQLDFKKVCAYWFDHKLATDREVYVPDGPPPKAGENVLRLPHLFNNEREAKAAAKAKFDETNREDESLSLTMIGNPDITAEGKIVLNNFRTGVDGNYIVKSATHSFSRGGYQTSLSAYVEP